MNNYKKYVFIIFIAFLFIPLFSSASMEKTFYMSEEREKEGIESVKKNADKIDILAPQFYGVSSSLKFNGGLSDEFRNALQQAQSINKNMKVMPLVTNYAFKQNIIHNLLISIKAQDLFIKSLIAEAKKEKYIGWQFDFENINYLDKDLYSAFVEKSVKALHDNGLILSVAAVSRSVDYENTSFFKNWGGAFDYERLAKAVDFISLMTYDDPNSVGPVASLPYINGVLNYVKDKIPAEKLSFGIPLYYWGWSMTPYKKIRSMGTYSRILNVKANFSYNLGYDDIFGATWLTYYFNNQQYKIWYQGKQSFENKLNIINQNNFRGFSAWVLGLEDPAIWSALSY